VNPAERPIMFMALMSDTLPLYKVDEYAETLMAQRISMVNGVASVQVYGSKYAVRVQADPDKLAAYGVGIDDLSKAIGEANTNLPTGKLYGEKQSFTVMSNGQLNDAAEYRRLIVTYRNGTPVRLEQVANVIDDLENNKSGSWYDGRRGIMLAIQKQ